VDQEHADFKHEVMQKHADLVNGFYALGRLIRQGYAEAAFTLVTMMVPTLPGKARDHCPFLPIGLPLISALSFGESHVQNLLDTMAGSEMEKGGSALAKADARQAILAAKASKRTSKQRRAATARGSVAVEAAPQTVMPAEDRLGSLEHYNFIDCYSFSEKYLLKLDQNNKHLPAYKRAAYYACAMGKVPIKTVQGQLKVIDKWTHLWVLIKLQVYRTAKLRPRSSDTDTLDFLRGSTSALAAEVIRDTPKFWSMEEVMDFVSSNAAIADEIIAVASKNDYTINIGLQTSSAIIGTQSLMKFMPQLVAGGFESASQVFKRSRIERCDMS
jgi:hypothetical protein